MPQKNPEGGNTAKSIQAMNAILFLHHVPAAFRYKQRTVMEVLSLWVTAFHIIKNYGAHFFALFPNKRPAGAIQRAFCVSGFGRLFGWCMAQTSASDVLIMFTKGRESITRQF